MQGEVTFEQTPEHRKISRVAIPRLLQSTHRCIPSSVAAGDCSSGIEHVGIVGNRVNRSSDVLFSNIILPESVIIVKGLREMCFPQVRLKFERSVGAFLRFFKTRSTFILTAPD